MNFSNIEQEIPEVQLEENVKIGCEALCMPIKG